MAAPVRRDVGRDELTTPADHAWQAYSDTVWPGLNFTTWRREGRDPADMPGRLLDLPATTPAGLQAKAAAVLAIDEAASYLTDCRNDTAELWASVIRDAAGTAPSTWRRRCGYPHPIAPGRANDLTPSAPGRSRHSRRSGRRANAAPDLTLHR